MSNLVIANQHTTGWREIKERVDIGNLKSVLIDETLARNLVDWTGTNPAKIKLRLVENGKFNMMEVVRA